MMRRASGVVGRVVLAGGLLAVAFLPRMTSLWAEPAGTQAAAAVALPELAPAKTIAASDCTAARVGSTIPASAIGEPVSKVTLAEPSWVAATESAPAYCTVDGAIAPVDPAAPLINFRVTFPASWGHRACSGRRHERLHSTAGRRTRCPTHAGRSRRGSDSGHQAGRRVAQWTLRRRDQEPRLRR